ncbi:hypothetical protein HOY80DRAFT_881873, partial [Tuber brumale]
SQVYQDRRVLQYLSTIILCCCFPYPHDKDISRVRISEKLNSDRGIEVKLRD